MSDTYIPLLRDSKDIYYRYKMPKLTAKVEGSGNGIKTVITNMNTIAKALYRPATYPTKYFGCELGAQVFMNPERNEYIVNGAHDSDKLLSLLYSFIQKFVLCEKCNNPETRLEIDKNKRIQQSCAACSHSRIIPNTTHKLTNYIINHPPNDIKKPQQNGKHTKKEKKNKKSGSESPKNDADDDDDKQTIRKNSDNNQNDEDDDEFDSEECTEEAHEQRMKQLVNGFNGVYINPEQIKMNANQFLNEVIALKETNELLNGNAKHIQLLNSSIQLGIRDKATLLLSEALFTQNIIQEIKKYKFLLLRFCLNNKKAQKYLLCGIEKLIGDLYKDALINKSINIFKCLYDEDICDEDVIIEWSSKASKKYVSKEISKQIREKIQPFIKWLKEAEVEDDDNDSSDESNHKDEIEIEYTHRVTGIKIETVKETPVTNGNGHSHEQNGKTIDDELNIDDI